MRDLMEVLLQYGDKLKLPVDSTVLEEKLYMYIYTKLAMYMAGETFSQVHVC